MNWALLLNPAVVWILIPIVAILGNLITVWLRMYQNHAERIAMIENGLHPDNPNSVKLFRDARLAETTPGSTANPL